MQCKCGAATQSKSSVVTKLKAEFNYQECGACTRVSSENLKIDGQIVARGAEAQRIFNGDLEGFINTPHQGALFI